MTLGISLNPDEPNHSGQVSDLEIIVSIIEIRQSRKKNTSFKYLSPLNVLKQYFYFNLQNRGHYVLILGRHSNSKLYGTSPYNFNNFNS